ncbi:hypothetical protein [Grimontia hollisae]|uniref:hypothetical protein n=1 Tax=Grimontia hollisae TaxID=673 RepID=UPI001303576B|nr:hypothetical protein [Grimontia hollisae]
MHTFKGPPPCEGGTYPTYPSTSCDPEPEPPPSDCSDKAGTTTQINLPYHLKGTSSLCMPNSCITVKDDDVILCTEGDETTPPTCAPVTFRYTGETCTYSDTPDDNLNPPTTDTGGGGGGGDSGTGGGGDSGTGGDGSGTGGDGSGTGGDGSGTGGDGTGTGGDGTGTGGDGTGTGGDGSGTGGDGSGTGGDGSGTGGDGSGTGGDGSGTGGDGSGTGGSGFGSPESGENPWDTILNGEDIEGLQTKVTMLELEVKQAIDNVRGLIATPNLSEGGSMPLFQFNLSHAGGSTAVSTQWMNQIFGDMKSVILLIASMIAFMIVLTRRA